MPAASDTLAALLAAVHSRGQIKALGARLDQEPALREAALALAVARGIEAPAEGRRLVRALLDRSEAAQVRGNPVRVDEAFACLHCGAEVPPGGARVRDHCPRCLRSLHLDVVPGDRSADCGGLLDPVGFSRSHGEVVVHYRCRRCGAGWRARAHPEDRIPASLPGEINQPERWMPEREGRILEPMADEGRELENRARTLPMRVLEAIRRGALWAPEATVLVAVSGGVDSTVLLHLLARLAHGHGGDLRVCSVDHGLRPEAAEEVAAVARQARDLDLPFTAIRLDLPPGANLAARAREARRAALLGLGADRIATGHQQDDQAETALYHLLRGSGAAGLRGMQPLDAPWCKPLLGEPRAVLEAWARAEGIRWMEDPSNTNSQRGALRRLMPLLDNIQGGASEALARSARLIARDDALLETLAERASAEVAREEGVDLAALQALPPALGARILRRMGGGSPLRADQVEAALVWRPEEGAWMPLAGGARWVVLGGVLRLEAG